jgi:surface antigen
MRLLAVIAYIQDNETTFARKEMKTMKTSMFATTCSFVALALAGCATTESEPTQDEDIFEESTLDQKVAMPACGTVLSTFQGVNAYSNGVNTGTGRSCAGVGTHGLQYQCVELAMRFFKVKYGVPHWSGNANTLLAGASRRAGMDVYRNSDAAHPPVPGDMIVWTTAPFGHVAIVTAVTSNSVSIIEQNVNAAGRARLSYDGRTVGGRGVGRARPAGWIHARANRFTHVDGQAWSCDDSRFGGDQLWTCSGSSLNKCVNGVPVAQACGNGCDINPAGTDDTCKAEWSCQDSEFAGRQVWTCEGNSRYRCENGVVQKEACAQECQVQAAGSDDVCVAAP